jgi:hypothetical protein
MRLLNGQVTTEPLWPLPMEQRLTTAQQRWGLPLVNVTQAVEAMLGEIPNSCRSDSTPVPPDPSPPESVSMTCSGDLLAAGKIALECNTTSRKR